jgi:hypothetical protein
MQLVLGLQQQRVQPGEQWEADWASDPAYWQQQQQNGV